MHTHSPWSRRQRGKWIFFSFFFSFSSLFTFTCLSPLAFTFHSCNCRMNGHRGWSLQVLVKMQLLLLLLRVCLLQLAFLSLSFAVRFIKYFTAHYINTAAQWREKKIIYTGQVSLNFQPSSVASTHTHCVLKILPLSLHLSVVSCLADSLSAHHYSTNTCASFRFHFYPSISSSSPSGVSTWPVIFTSKVIRSSGSHLLTVYELSHSHLRFACSPGPDALSHRYRWTRCDWSPSCLRLFQLTFILHRLLLQSSFPLSLRLTDARQNAPAPVTSTQASGHCFDIASALRK